MTSSNPFVERLRAAPRSERRRLLEQTVAAEIREVLLMAPGEHVPPDESVFGLGLSSLGAVNLKERLEARLGCTIDADVLFSHPTMAHLVSYLTEGELRDLYTVDDPPPDAAAPSTDSSTKALVDDVLKKVYRG